MTDTAPHMRHITHILFATATIISILAFFTSCSNEDDIEEIFIGRTWYMNGATVNGLKLNSDIKNFYTSAGPNAYYISFAPSTFKGVMAEGKTFSGTWQADGKNQTITLKVTTPASLDTPFDKQIYNIIVNTTRYTSGADFLQLKQDGGNIVIFGASRTEVIN